MKSHRIWLVAAVIVLFVAAAAVWSQQGTSDRPGAERNAIRARAFQKLSPEQRAQLREKVRGMRAEGASREEIHATVRKMLKGWGIKPPKRPMLNALQRLSPEQRAQLREKVRGMRAEGASREEIHATVRKMLKGWGIKPPKRPMLNALRKLSPEQRAQLREKIRETVRKFLREAEASSC